MPAQGVTSASDAMPTDVFIHIIWRLGFKQSSFRHITRVPQTPQSQHLDLTVAFLACDSPVHLSDPG